MHVSQVATDCFQSQYELHEEEGEREQEELHARSIFRSLATNGGNSIYVGSVPTLFELLGVPYSLDEHAVALRRLTTDSRIHEDDFIAWYLDWMFGANVYEEINKVGSDAGNPITSTRKSPAEIATEWATFEPVEESWQCTSCAATNTSANYCMCLTVRSRELNPIVWTDAATRSVRKPLTTEIWKCAACTTANRDLSAATCSFCGEPNPSAFQASGDLRLAYAASAASSAFSFGGNSNSTPRFSCKASVNLNSPAPGQGFSFSCGGAETDIGGLIGTTSPSAAVESSNGENPRHQVDEKAFIKLSDGDSEDEQEERKQEEDNARPIFRSMVTNGTNSISTTIVPKLFEALGVPYSQTEHGSALARFTKDGLIHEDAFIVWYLDWMFGVNEYDDDEDDGVIASEATLESILSETSPAEFAPKAEGRIQWRNNCAATNLSQDTLTCCSSCQSNHSHNSVDSKSVDEAEMPLKTDLNAVVLSEGFNLMSECGTELSTVENHDFTLAQLPTTMTLHASATGDRVATTEIIQKSAKPTLLHANHCRPSYGVS